MADIIDKQVDHISPPAAEEQVDSGLVCLTIISGLLGITSEYQQLKRIFSVNGEPVNTTIILRAAKKIGLKAKRTKRKGGVWSGILLPLIAILNDGTYVVVAKADEGKLWIFDPQNNKSESVEIEDFNSLWTGEVILFKKRLSFSSVVTYFNLQWFIPTMYRFRKLFGEVIVIAFVLQILGLVSPLFSQVIIDKVLVHKGVSTLDILAMGLCVVGVFELALGILKQYLFSHATNRVDVLLGTQLFHHLSALPIRYFEARRVGDVANRMRELDIIRQFITGSALNVVLDIFFGTVFVIAMFFYSVTLSFIVLGTIPLFILLSLTAIPIYKRRLNRQFACASESQSFLVEYITGVNTVKSLAIEPQMNHRWENLLSRYVRTTFSTMTLANVAGNTAQFIQKISNLAILWFGAHLVMDGALTVGQLIAFQMLSGKVTDPILRLVNAWQDFQQAKLSVDRLGDILNYPPESALDSNHVTGKFSV
jgi:subfamily B ATP-binding cassette protein HlyB/CyaB